MTTRDEYEAQVQRPGKFEGERPWAPYFYERILEGWGEPHYVNEDDIEPGTGDIYVSDDAEIEYTEVNLMPEDWEVFPELNPQWGSDNPDGMMHIRVFESSIGFVHAELVRP